MEDKTKTGTEQEVTYTDEEKFYGDVARAVRTGGVDYFVDVAKAIRAAVYVDPIEALAISLGLRHPSYDLLTCEGTEIAKSAYALGARAPKEGE